VIAADPYLGRESLQRFHQLLCVCNLLAESGLCRRVLVKRADGVAVDDVAVEDDSVGLEVPDEREHEPVQYLSVVEWNLRIV
jgi:hypothetical protein